MNHAKDGVQVPTATAQRVSSKPGRRAKVETAMASAQGMGTRKFGHSRSGGMGYAGVRMAGSTR